MKRFWVIIISAILVMCMSGCERKSSEYQEGNSTETNAYSDQEVFNKGYNLTISQNDIKQAEDETWELLDQIEKQYLPYLDDENQIPENILENMADTLANKGYLVRADGIYSNIKNEEILEGFLEDAKEGKQGRAVLYELRNSGAAVRHEYRFDSSDMYVFTLGMEIKKDGTRCQTVCSYTRLKKWRYTDEGWFCYELCVPEYPEVTETVDGSVLIRVKPISEEFRQAGERYVLGIGYQGNNLLCSNWDIDNLDTLDYTGMYEYLYAINTGERFVLDEDAEGIPADEFEGLIMEYIPTSQETIRRRATFNRETEEYYWTRLGCMNYSPTFFGTSYPEVVDIKENDDGTITLTVNAVCEMVLNEEAIITHELTIKENEDGSFMYMGNKILGDGINRIPDYKYRDSI